MTTADPTCSRTQFDSAVRIITNLPKDGSFQPSSELKLRFYAYFKQATHGPCTESKPPFWDVVKRAKWDAWKSLNCMSKRDAMFGYVDALRQVIETMSYSSDVQNFIDQLDSSPFYNNDDINDHTEESATPVDPNLKHVRNIDKPAKVNGHANGFSKQCSSNRVSSNRSLSDVAVSEEEIFTDATAETHLLDLADITTRAEPNHESGFAESFSTEPPNSGGHTTDENNKIDSVDGSCQTFDAPAIAVLLGKKVAGDRSGSAEPTIDACRPATVGRQLRQISDDGGEQQHRFEQQLGVENDVIDRRRRRRPQSELNRPTIADGSPPFDAAESSTAGPTRREADFRLSQAEKRALTRWRPKVRRRPTPAAGNKKNRGGDGEPTTTTNVSDSNSRATADATGGRRTINPIIPAHSGHHEQSVRRNGRNSSGSDSTSRGECSSSSVDWDPRVGAVLLRMHRQLQNVSRQLDLVESVLLTQHQMIRSALGVQADYRFLANLPWKTLAFLTFWPFAVNLLIRFARYKFLRKRTF